jgi:hypothetical protein
MFIIIIEIVLLLSHMLKDNDEDRISYIFQRNSVIVMKLILLFSLRPFPILF